jgi:hypothetical protein
MVVSIRETGSEIKCTEKGSSSGRQENDTKANIQRIRRTVRENWSIPTVPSMKAVGRTENEKVLVSSQTKEEERPKNNGAKIVRFEYIS